VAWYRSSRIRDGNDAASCVQKFARSYSFWCHFVQRVHVASAGDLMHRAIDRELMNPALALSVDAMTPRVICL
jgi:hypothetical protein